MRQHIETIFRYRCFQGCLQNSIQTIEYYIFQIVEKCLMLCESLEWKWWHRKRLDENLRKEKHYAMLALFSFLSHSRCSERFPYCSNPRLVRSTFKTSLVRKIPERTRNRALPRMYTNSIDIDYK